MTLATAHLVGQVMTKGMVTVRAGARLEEAAQVMDAQRVHGVVVLDDESTEVVGVLSQTDLLRARASDVWANLSGVPVRLVMTAPALTISIDADLDDATRLMKHRRVHRLVVIGHDGITPVGVLSLTDLVRVMAGPEAL
ncbi:MAG TPA: CBS domain-containing protein [Candidatus Limnocylindria bacterium]|jgi:CBS domain-containing protein